MPHVTAAIIATLATYAPDAPAVAARDDAGWCPFFARFDARAAIGAARGAMGRGAGPRAVLDALGALPLPLAPGELRALRDWDTPDDVDA